ncbi:hypothetical protein ACSBR2_008979 [Camellia fascicularis]
MPVKGRRDERNGEQIGGPANGHQFHDAEQRHAVTVPFTRYADSNGQERGGRKRFLQSRSMARLRDILTGLRGRSGMENPRRLVEQKKPAPKNIEMFRRRNSVSTRPMEGGPKGLTITLEVVHQRGLENDAWELEFTS